MAELICAECARPIMPGDLFSRRTVRVPHVTALQRRVVVCAVCRPLRLEGYIDAPAPTDEEYHEGIAYKLRF